MKSSKRSVYFQFLLWLLWVLYLCTRYCVCDRVYYYPFLGLFPLFYFLFLFYFSFTRRLKSTAKYTVASCVRFLKLSLHVSSLFLFIFHWFSLLLARMNTYYCSFVHLLFCFLWFTYFYCLLFNLFGSTLFWFFDLFFSFGSGPNACLIILSLFLL